MEDFNLHLTGDIHAITRDRAVQRHGGHRGGRTVLELESEEVESPEPSWRENTNLHEVAAHTGEVDGNHTLLGHERRASRNPRARHPLVAFEHVEPE
jgi:hypothetical protein